MVFNYHYRVIDIKCSKLHLNTDSKTIRNNINIKPFKTQIAIYTKATGVLGHQIICTPNATTLLRPEEHERLQMPYLDEILRQVYQKLMVRQNLLKLCNDATTFMRLSEPDFKSWKIQDWNPEYKQLLRGVYDY